MDIDFTVSNDDKAIKVAIKQLKSHHPERIIIEATGRLAHGLIMACANAHLPFAVANPVPVKKVAGAIGQRAKTDKLGARFLS